jgi:hypothetical protein
MWAHCDRGPLLRDTFHEFCNIRLYRLKIFYFTKLGFIDSLVCLTTAGLLQNEFSTE